MAGLLLTSLPSPVPLCTESGQREKASHYTITFTLKALRCLCPVEKGAEASVPCGSYTEPSVCAALTRGPLETVRVPEGWCGPLLRARLPLAFSEP